MEKMTKEEAEYIKTAFITEFNRLLNTGHVSEKTTRQTVINVALAHLSERYMSDKKGFQDLRSLTTEED